MMDLFQLGYFRLHSGDDSRFKIECDALTDGSLRCIAYLLSLRLPPFGSVEGVPLGGLRLAEKLKPYRTQGPLLIVDDVVTTGGSMERHRAGREAIGAAIFGRGKVPDWVTPLFPMTPELVV